MWFRNKRFAPVIAVLCLSSVLLCSCDQKQDSGSRFSNIEVLVRADISLKPTLLELSENFSFVTNYKIKFQFVPSNQLFSSPKADSIDIFIFANDSFIEAARSANLADTTGDLTLAYAVPCLIVPRFNPHMITALSDLKNQQLRVGIANPESDVLGAFSLELLEKNGLLPKIDRRLTFVGPSALDLAQSVSKSQFDVAVSWTVSVNWFPESFDMLLLVPNEIPRIAAVSAIRSANPVNTDNADRLITYLKSDRCLNIFRKWGYLTTDSDVDMYAPAAIIGGEPDF